MSGCKCPAVIRILNAVIVCLGVAAGGLALCWALLTWQSGAEPAGPRANPEISEDSQTPDEAPEASPPDGISALETALAEDPTDPALYRSLAQAYREADRDEDAREILQAGAAATGAEELASPLEAVKATLTMPELQREDLTALLEAFPSDDTDTFSAAFQSWFNHTETTHGLSGEVPWADENGLAWDGSRFWSDYTGTGLLLWGDQVYCGEIVGNIPNGSGSTVAIDTWYPNNIVSYLRMDAQWENGVAVGDFTMRLRCTGVVEYSLEYDITGTLDGTDAEIMTAAQVTVRPTFSGSKHQFQFSIRDGALDLDSFNSSYYGDAAVSCSAHTGCGARLLATPETLAIRCQNPYPWGRSSPMEDPWMFLNFSYSY